MDAARNQIIGSSAGLIPFVEHNYVYRSLMGSNQQRQAVPLIQPQAPIVGTGIEAVAAANTGQVTPGRGRWRSHQSYRARSRGQVQGRQR